MEILYISPSLPNDFSRIRTKNIINSLLLKGHSVSLISLSEREKDKLSDKELLAKLNDVKIFKQNKFCSFFNCLLGLFLPVPLQNSYVNNKKLHKYLKNCNKDYDLIYIKRLRMAQYARYFNDKNVIIDLTDSLTKYYDRVSKKVNGIKKILNIEEYLKHFIYEKKIVNKYTSIVCSNDEKKYLLEKLKCNENKIYVLENLIDFKQWDIPYNYKNKDKTKLVFSGMMDYDPNIIAVNYFIKNILRNLDNKYNFFVIGKNKSKELIDDEKVKYIGFVKNMGVELAKYDIYVCPIIAGSGVKNKILQAMSIGLPIISTKFGIEGINEECKKYIYIANSKEEYIKAINEINNLTKIECKKLMKMQKEFILKNYNISKAEKIICKIWEDVILNV